MSEGQQSSKKKNATKYVVMIAEEKLGSWTPVGEFVAHGQQHAMSLAARKLGNEDREKYWFIAIPASSYAPKKPKVKVTTQISFLDD